jgi:hypothetical protein
LTSPSRVGIRRLYLVILSEVEGSKHAVGDKPTRTALGRSQRPGHRRSFDFAQDDKLGLGRLKEDQSSWWLSGLVVLASPLLHHAVAFVRFCHLEEIGEAFLEDLGAVAGHFNEADAYALVAVREGLEVSPGLLISAERLQDVLRRLKGFVEDVAGGFEAGLRYFACLMQAADAALFISESLLPGLRGVKR